MSCRNVMKCTFSVCIQLIQSLIMKNINVTEQSLTNVEWRLLQLQITQTRHPTQYVMKKNELSFTQRFFFLNKFSMSVQILDNDGWKCWSYRLHHRLTTLLR